MLRFALTFLLTVTLLIACRGDRVQPHTTDWITGNQATQRTITTLETAPPFVWWEAETPTATNFPARDRHPFTPANATEASTLSAQQWIGVEGKRTQSLFLEYTVTVPDAGSYFFYTRKFWQHGPFRWRWDDQPWQTITREVYLMDSVPMRQFVEMNWISLGQVTLPRGTHTLRIELTEQDGAAAFDCFVLTQERFRPSGILKPNEQYTATVTEGFLFQPKPDPFTATPLDLRYLNETKAGEKGFIQAQGEQFVHSQTGQPVRFWAVNVGEQALLMDPALMASTARFLAKHGVNLVRVHAPFWTEDLQSVDSSKRDRLFNLVEALKQEGIYTALSIYFPVWLDLKATQGFAGYTGQKPFALLFFNPDLQQRYANWWTELLSSPNPRTGQPLRDDPALAVVELVNEDSYFFWTFQPYETVPAPQMTLLEQQFGQWLTQKYGSLAQAIATWNNPAPIRGDDLPQGRMGIVPLSELTGQPNSQRSQDTAHFLADSQQQFFTRAIAHLRQTLGYKGLIYASNWITADAQRLGPLDKYTNTVADVMDRHGYFSGPHAGSPSATYAIGPGETYHDRSALLFTAFDKDQAHDFTLPIMDVRYNDKPSILTEVNWSLPNRFRADFPLLAAAYGALQETDGVFFFATNQPSWASQLGKFAIATPTVMGQFPAIALMYRQGMIAPGKTVVDVALNTNELFQLQGAPLTAPQNLDEFRAKDIPPGQVLQSDRIPTIDPLAFLVGKVNLRFTTQAATAQQTDLSPYIDRPTQTIRSSTKQLQWNYHTGLVTIDAPQAQGATGFLRKAQTITLANMQINAEMDYGTVLLVALDEQPLARSQRMLLQVMSEEQNLGWKTTGTHPKTIEHLGGAPLAVRNLAGTVALQRPNLGPLKVTALDFNGYPDPATPTVDPLRANPGKANDTANTVIDLRPNTFYYLLEATN